MLIYICNVCGSILVSKIKKNLLMKNNQNIVLLMMGGIGSRVGNSLPKQFIEIEGVPIFVHILKGLNELECIDKILIVCCKDWIDYAKKCCSDICVQKLCDIIPGGETRSDSIVNGLKKAKEFAFDNDVIMMFDTTHPYIDKKGIENLISAINEYGGATLGQRQYDTCYRIDKKDMLIEVVPRNEIVSGASPEGFRFKTIYDIYMNSSKEELSKMTSAGAIALAHNVPMKICTLNNLNLKITYPEDIEVLKHLINYNFNQKL